MMKRYRFTSKQFLPTTRQHAWDFFSSPKNLSLITPKKLNFKILFISGSDKVHAGQIIGYRVTVLPFVRLNWETEITEVIEYQSFTDIQRKGPYSYWSHKHSFRDADGGIEMTDELEYSIPFGALGRLTHFVLVEREIKSIFNYRFHVIQELFKKYI